jgi:hypothetical protein
MKYLELFRLDLLHPYYADSRCLDFQIEPTTGTQKLLRDCRCVLKSAPGGIRVLVPVTEKNVPFVSLPEKPIFAFHLRLQNPNFSLFTDLTDLSALAAPLYTNPTPARAGELELVSREAWLTEHFVVQQPNVREAFSLAGRPLKKLKTAGPFIVNGLGAKTGSKNYDENARVLAVNTAKASIGTPFTITYPTAPHLETGVFADIEINFNHLPVELRDNTRAFRVVFKAKEARWKYYIVTDGKMTSAALEDRDKVVVFDAQDLTESLDPLDETAKALAERYPGMQYFRFLSNTLIPCQQAARKGIQLQLNGNKAMDSLPNPALQNYSIDTRNAEKEYTLYQIVKYFTH